MCGVITLGSLQSHQSSPALWSQFARVSKAFSTTATSGAKKRAAAELIKSEGFSFLQLTGDYKEFTTHANAFQRFTANVEGLIRSEIKEYIVAVSSKPGNGKDNTSVP